MLRNPSWLTTFIIHLIDKIAERYYVHLVFDGRFNCKAGLYRRQQ